MPWLFAPTERGALGDVAKLAATLRAGTIAAPFLDGGEEVALGMVGRVVLLGAGDLGLTATGARRFVLARGTTAWCLAEVIEGAAGRAAAEALLVAAAALSAREPEHRVIAWLVAARVDAEAAALLAGAGALATSTEG